MRSPFVLLTMAFGAVCGTATEAWACSCVESSPCQRFAQSETIFLGRVLEVTQHESSQVARLEVVRIHRGAPDRVVTVTGPGRRSSCTFGFRVGERFLFNGRGSGAAFQAHPCSGSGSVPDGEPDPELPRAGQVSGSLQLMNENFSSMRDLWSPLAGKRVWIRTPDRVLETTTGADGRFTIDEVPSGTHSVQADLGPEVVASSRFRLASPLDCAQVLVSPEPAGRIVGTLVGRGFPVAGIEVRAVKIQDGVEVTGVWTQRSGRPDANGRFEIHGLKAGQYLLSVNPGAAPTMRQPIPTTHYPGVRERSEAQLVVVEYGTTAVIPPFELTTIMSGRTINAAVSCLDGTRPTEFNLFATRPGDRFHSESSFSSKEPVSRITVLQGVEYDLHATISFQQPDGAGRPPTRTTIKSDIVRIAADETPSLVRLTLPLERCP